MWNPLVKGVRELSPSAFPPVRGKQYIPFKLWSERGAIARKHCRQAGHTPVIVIDFKVTAEQYLYLEYNGLIDWDASHDGWRCYSALPLYLFSSVVHDYKETATWQAEAT